MGRRRARRSFDAPSRRRSMAAQDERKSKRRGKWGAGIRKRFLALLRETGNAAAALRVVGHPNMFYKRRRSDPLFAAQWAAAVAEADERHSRATGRLVEDGTGTPARAGAGTAGRSRAEAVERLGAFAIADPATLLRPGPKRTPKERGHVIRRTRGGRTQIALARECEMTAESEADFLARLKATGNFSGSARAVGFHPASLFDRYRKWPAFARACDGAIAEAEIELDFGLIAHAHRLLRRPGADIGTSGGSREGIRPPEEEMEEEAERVPFDPVAAIRILAFVDRRRAGRSGRGARKGPPQRTFEQVRASVLEKIEAIERHDAMMKARSEEERDGSGNDGNGGNRDGEGGTGDGGNGDGCE